MNLATANPSCDTLWSNVALDAFTRASRATYGGRYGAADSAASQLARVLPLEGRLLQASVDLSQFADLHDPWRLESARAGLSRVTEDLSKDNSPRGRFLNVLALSQKSYLETLEANTFAAALSGRKAASVARELVDEGCHNPELEGILGGYLFWKAQTLGAFASALGGDTRSQGLEWTARAGASSSPFREAFRTSLLWMRFERHEYAAALQVAQDAKASSGHNRIMKQAEGDLMFRLERLGEALLLYRESFLEYRGIEVLPVNRMAAAGNLARIHEALGQADSARAWLDTIDAHRYAQVRKWLPPSLVRELVPVRRRLNHK